MSGNKNLMSENLKTEIAKELGVYGCEGNRNRK